MSYNNKIVFGNKVLIDLTKDTVVESALKKGYTAHKSDGSIIHGTFDGVSEDSVKSILQHGFKSGTLEYVDDGTTLTIKNKSTNQTLIKTITPSIITIVLKASNGSTLGTLTKRYTNNGLTITYEFNDKTKVTKEFTEKHDKMTEKHTDISGHTTTKCTKTWKMIY